MADLFRRLWCGAVNFAANSSAPGKGASVRTQSSVAGDVSIAGWKESLQFLIEGGPHGASPPTNRSKSAHFLHPGIRDGHLKPRSFGSVGFFVPLVAWGATDRGKPDPTSDYLRSIYSRNIPGRVECADASGPYLVISPEGPGL